MSIKVAGQAGIEGTTAGLRVTWEATSFQLERLQCDPACVDQEASDAADVRRPCIDRVQRCSRRWWWWWWWC